MSSLFGIGEGRWSFFAPRVLELIPSTGLYAGIGPKLLQSALTAAFMFVAQRRIYEAVKGLIVVLQQRKALLKA